MGEPFAEFIAAERALDRQAWARAEAARLPAAELASIDVFQLRNEIAACHANQQPTTAVLLAASWTGRSPGRQPACAPPPRRGGTER